MTELKAGRHLDHLVLPTRSLDDARRRLTALGFTVAPEGTHPFGTSNCCVYFPGGTFLEPLAVTASDLAVEATRSGNMFVAHDAAFRRLVGDEGLSAIVLATDDADADHWAFVAAGVSAGDPLTFSRPFKDPSGATGTATFRLAFARTAAAPEFLLFTCQRVGVPKVDRAALERHANGVVAIASIRIEVADPVAVAGLFDAAGVATGSGIRLGDVRVELVKGRGAAAVTFRTGDLPRASDLLKAAGARFTKAAGRLAVTAVAGQGADFLFQDR